MNLIKFSYREDFGHEWYVQVLFTKRWALFQGSLLWNDCPSWPYIQIKSGTGSVLSILFWGYRLGFDIGVIERTWDWDYLNSEVTLDEIKENDKFYSK